MDDNQRRFRKAIQVSTLEAISWLLFVSVMLASPFWLGQYYLVALFYASFAAVFLRLSCVVSWHWATAIALAVAAGAAAFMNMLRQGM